MASRTPPAGSSRRPSAHNIAIADRDTNNRRLAQAISYLKSEGGSDSHTEYRERVQDIDDFVVEQYLHEGYSFDPKLWRQLRAMVQEAQSNFQYSDGDRGYVDESSEEEDDDVEGAQRLYRTPTMTEIEMNAALAEYRSSGFGSGAGVSSSRPPIRSERSAGSQVGPPNIKLSRTKGSPPLDQAIQPELLERVFKYGGPNNEPEEWLKTFPPSLPFGETLQMQKLESLMIDYDLRKSAENLKSGNNDPIVKTDVKYDDASLQYVGQYDSGSKFKLPETPSKVQNLLNGQALNLMNVLEDFNLGGGEAAQIRRDYAPRIFLERICAHPSYNEGNSTRTPAAPRRASSTSTSSQSRLLSLSQTSSNRRATSSNGRRDSATSIGSSARPIARRALGALGHTQDQDSSKIKFRRSSGPVTYRQSDPIRDGTLSSRKPAVMPRRHSEPMGTMRNMRDSTDAGPSRKTNIQRRSSTGQHPTAKVPKSALGKRKLSIASDGFGEQVSKKRRGPPSPPTRSPKARAAKGVRFAKRNTSIGSEDIVIRASNTTANKVTVPEKPAMKPKPAAPRTRSEPVAASKTHPTAKGKPGPKLKASTTTTKPVRAKAAPKEKPALKKVESKVKPAIKKATSKAQPFTLKSKSAVANPVVQRKTGSKKSALAQRRASTEKALEDTKEHAPSPNFARHVTRSNKKFGR